MSLKMLCIPREAVNFITEKSISDTQKRMLRKLRIKVLTKGNNKGFKQPSSCFSDDHIISRFF